MCAPVDVLAVMARKRAAFRDAGMRNSYDACVAAFRAKGATYLAEGNSAAVMFRRGFTGAHVGKWDAASRKTLAYAQFRAGQDFAQDEARAAVAELIEADQRAICRMERALEAAAGLNKLLPEAQPIRDLLSTVVGQTSLAIEAKRAALARVKGVQP